ncbi:MAG: hypothetical protein ACJATI_004077 [Halioglobus sp.]|jgi:hypothetical protein
MKVYFTTSIFIFLVLILSNCSSKDTKPTASRFTMRENSELTLLMRDMFEYYDSLKVNIEKGEIPKNIKDFNEIHWAVSTEPSKVKSELYQAMATVYKESADGLKNKEIDMPKAFNLMVDNCMNCHKQMCPGPMVRIKKLYLQDVE